MSAKNKDFRGKDFRGCNYLDEKADFTYAHLEGANFTDVNLQEADFTSAFIQGTNFTGARLEGAIFTNAIAGARSSQKIALLIIAFLLITSLEFLSIGLGIQVSLSVKIEAVAFFFMFIAVVCIVLSILSIFVIRRGFEDAKKTWEVTSDSKLLINLFSFAEFSGALFAMSALACVVLKLYSLSMLFAVFTAPFLIVPLFFAVGVAGYPGAYFSGAVSAIIGLFFMIGGIDDFLMRNYFLNLETIIVLNLIFVIAATAIIIKASLKIIQNPNNFSYVRLIMVNFVASNGTSFRKANLTGAKFNKTTIKEVDFREAILIQTSFKEARKLHQARQEQQTYSALSNHELRNLLVTGIGNNKKYSNADLHQVNLDEAFLNEANLSGCNLKGSTLVKAQLNGAILEGADLTNANLEGAFLNEANLSGCNLKGATLVKAQLNNAILDGTDLTNANLDRAFLNKANLSGCNLKGATLVKAQLNDAILEGADLTNVNLEGVDLTRANLKGSDLTGANLKDAILTNANLKDAQAVRTNLTRANLTGACLGGWNVDEDTKIDEVECLYFFGLEQENEIGSRKRRPHDHDRYFQPGEFNEYYNLSLKVVQLMIKADVNPKAFAYALKQLQQKFGAEMKIIEKTVDRKGVKIGYTISTSIDEGHFEKTFYEWLNNPIEEASGLTMINASNVALSFFLNSELTMNNSSFGEQTIIIGDNNNVVNRSTVQNAFNMVSTEYDEDTAKALLLVEKEINNSGNQEAVENFNSFSEELLKPEPKKSLLKTLWKGTTDALPAIVQITGVVTSITKLFS